MNRARMFCAARTCRMSDRVFGGDVRRRSAGMGRARRGLAAGAAFGALAGCTVGPKFAPPTPPPAAAWHDPSVRTEARVTPRSNPDPQWWQNFADPELDRLMQRAIAGNLDLQQAVLRVMESRQQVAVARAAGLPSLNGQAEYTREQLGLKGILDSQGAYSGLNSLADKNSKLNQYQSGLGNTTATDGTQLLNKLSGPINLFQYGLDASWELDLFGRVRRSVEQARAQSAAQVEATNDALVMLESDVARAYMQLRGAQALTASQQANITEAQDSLQLTQIRQLHGLATGLDVEQARTQLSDTQRSLPGYESQAQQAINQLNVLVGQPPGTLDAELVPPAALPAVPLGLETTWIIAFFTAAMIFGSISSVCFGSTSYAVTIWLL